jgi:hypothetical protein
MPEDDVPSMLRMIEEKIASAEIEFQHRHALIRLRDILDQDLRRGVRKISVDGNGACNQETA